MSAISSVLNDYHTFREPSLTDRFFKHAAIEKLILQKPSFKPEAVGYSLEKRPVYLLQKGSGPIKVFLWSQMHGDEATGTMVLFDLMNFLEQKEGHSEVRDNILNACTLFIAPMINPDGAERFTRRNAQGIDINRDFLKQQTPEGRLLRQLRDKIVPDFGFNLHDQSVLWSAGRTGNPATISLLAPAFNEELEVNEVRKSAMQIIAGINRDIQPMIPHHVGLFDDEFEPRAFGDNFQAAGTSTILIEAGGYHQDPEKQFIRKVYFASILSGLKQIGENSYKNTPLSEYTSIPPNKKVHFSILIKNARLAFNGEPFTTDIGLIADEEVTAEGKSVLYNYVVDEIGDLAGRVGYHEFDAGEMTILLSQPLEINKAADFILQDGLNTILCFENGRISDKTSKFST
ncbi:MAG TPA: M14 metallopeptidase family protein [Sphingobacteriaceae bacterium]